MLLTGVPPNWYVLSRNYGVPFSELKREEKVDEKTVLALIRGRQARGILKITFPGNFYIFGFELSKREVSPSSSGDQLFFIFFKISWFSRNFQIFSKGILLCKHIFLILGEMLILSRLKCDSVQKLEFCSENNQNTALCSWLQPDCCYWFSKRENFTIAKMLCKTLRRICSFSSFRGRNVVKSYV